MTSGKPTLCIDFDGVIHDYKDGWQNGVIYGEVTPGFFEWAYQVAPRFKLVVYSSRSKDPRLLTEMREWLMRKHLEWKASVAKHPDWDIIDFEYASEKPAAWLTIDDRAIRFDGDWAARALSVDALSNFKPWMSRDA